MTSSKSTVSIAIPVLNEAQYIVPCLHSLLEQVDERRCEILVLDGGSTDATAELVATVSKTHPCIRLVANPQRNQAAAINLAARIAAPSAVFLVRADAHMFYPPGFVDVCLKAIQLSGAQSIVTPMYAVGQSGFQRAVAATQNSRLGNGGSPHRLGQAPSGFVDHGHHAVFDRQFFLDRGGYNETFTHNEDAEYDYRVHLAGGRVWMCADVPLIYFPRRNIISLIKQYFKHGSGRARTLATHRLFPKVRQLAPLVILAGVAGGIGLAPLNLWFGLLPLAYISGCTAWSVMAALKQRDVWLLAMAPAAVAMHLSWGAGFLRTMFKIAGRRRIGFKQNKTIRDSSHHGLTGLDRPLRALDP
jgi:succinoglycan biosynthesis protein ExoA